MVMSWNFFIWAMLPEKVIETIIKDSESTHFNMATTSYNLYMTYMASAKHLLEK